MKPAFLASASMIALLLGTVAALLGLSLSRTVKSLVLATDEKDGAGVTLHTTIWLLLVRGDARLRRNGASRVTSRPSMSTRPASAERSRSKSVWR